MTSLAKRAWWRVDGGSEQREGAPHLVYPTEITYMWVIIASPTQSVTPLYGAESMGVEKYPLTAQGSNSDQTNKYKADAVCG